MTMKYKILISVILILSVMLALGCSDRATETGETTELERGVFTHHQHVFFDELKLQVRNSESFAPYQHYLPEITWRGDHPVPLLVLLAPEGGDEYFYVHHGLGELASEMIDNDEIEPMVIVTLASEANEVFGGFFYAGDQLPGGKYDDIFASKLLAHLVTVLPAQIVDDPSKHGIGGIGMGAYGAFRAALLNPGDWGSVSAVDGPLDFDGVDGTSGLISLMDSVFVEQPTLTQANFRWEFDSSSSNPISRLFCGAALAFTPHDQDLDSLIIEEIYTNQGESVQRKRLSLDSLRGTIYHIISDSTTLIDSIITLESNDLDFHIPFSYDSRPYDPIWDIWMVENLENLYTGSELINTDVWIGTSPEAKWGYHDMTMSWVTTLGSTVDSVYEYEGYDGSPATNHQYVYNLLREMLLFHDASFRK
jgi:hypothetical protein